MAAGDYTNLVEKIYVGFFGRPADPTGLAYYTDLLNKANAPTTSAGLLSVVSSNTAVAAVFRSFGDSNEAKAVYTGYTTSNLVNTIYNYVLGRNAETGGLTYWTAKVDSGQINAAQLAFMVLQAAESDTNGDALTVASKVAVATAYTASLDLPSEISAYVGINAAASGRALLNGVYAGNTAAQFQSKIDANILALTGSTPTTPTGPSTPTAQTFTLTASVDTFTGGITNDSFNADNTTFSAADTLNGGAGTDTFNYTETGTVGGTLPAAPVSNIEIINIRNISPVLGTLDTVDASNFTGATTFNSDHSTSPVEFDNLSTSQQVGVIGNSAIVSGAVTAKWSAGVTTSTVNFSGGTLGTAGLTLNGGALSAVTLTSTGSANGTGTINMSSGTLTDLTINADTNFNTSGITGFKSAVTTNTVTVAGAASSVSLGSLANTIGVIDGSALTIGGITATLGTNTGIKFIGGGGNDVITSNGVALALGASVDAGGGTDRLVLTGAVAGSASAALYKNFEELKLNNVTQDVSLFTGSSINKLILDGGAVVQHASAAQAANIQIMSSGTYNIGVDGSTTVNLTVDDGLASNNVILLGSPLLTSIDTLKITANDTTSITGLTSALSLNNVTLTGSSVIGFVSGAANFTSTTLVVDATTATNTVGIDFQNAQSTGSGVTIKAGSASSILIGSQQGDTIIGGSGNDFLATGHAVVNQALAITSISTAVTTGVDILTGGAGNDSFIISHSTVANASAITDLNLGGNGSGGVDSLWFNGTGPTTIVALSSAQQTTVSGAGSLSAAVDAVLAVASATNNVVQFSYGADTYIVVNGAGTATYTSTQDTLIKVTGVVGTLDASDIHFMAS
ncbi:hypothetical protein M2401_006848 [Pseudomonas sp. JUb42]|uniref:beta strand repeat-containing protein n=1 Tax=Pseudomonas sp. JUb42 TaxID=2940611 RepID=UPI00216978FD|nr:DUF4214 domain-containing protein [Pseudomonas sp. JUb42]MCS3473080.1 hypothetical protein [Pseudomonas sp. JUb42]